MTPSEGKDSDSSDNKNIYYSYDLTCYVDSFGVFSFSLPFSPNSVVVVDFIGL